jgi:hypothetical protein
MPGIHFEYNVWNKHIVLRSIHFPPKAVHDSIVILDEALDQFLSLDSIDCSLVSSQSRHARFLVDAESCIRISSSFEEPLPIRLGTGRQHHFKNDIRTIWKPGCQHDFFALFRAQWVTKVGAVDAKSWAGRDAVARIWNQLRDQLRKLANGFRVITGRRQVNANSIAMNQRLN